MDKVLELLKDGNIVIPKLFLNKYKELELEDKEFILLMYLMNYNSEFNPKQIGLELGLQFKEVLELINNLCEKGFIEIEIKTENKIKKEYLNLDKLYNKLAFLVINRRVEKEEPKNLFSTFEKEFGRTLSPIEYNQINAWKDDNFSEELIFAALKEAILNGVTSLRYIDKILYEWKRKGITKVEDTQKKNKFNQEKNVEVYECDWLNEDE